MLRRVILAVGIAAMFSLGTGVCRADEIHLDLSNASISVTGTETFRVYHTTVPGV